MTEREKLGARSVGSDAALHGKPQCVESFTFVIFDSLLNAGKSLWQPAGENQQLTVAGQNGCRIWRQRTRLLKLLKRGRQSSLIKKNLGKIDVRINRMRIAQNGAAQMAFGLGPIVFSGIRTCVDSIRNSCSSGVFQ